MNLLLAPTSALSFPFSGKAELSKHIEATNDFSQLKQHSAFKGIIIKPSEISINANRQKRISFQ
ncbi:hypothetical protein ACFP1I_03990 [Dyadobacter subterraneus]|uniref:Uncharacterized protein n=1 Tax=Dyadobacter subterraneus TaxID=2773304 RepID=A0ABR9WHY1_9BACT|nr:hypothetical protein [Dyadobacter subterraneus]MBE9464709.1 hypothetical protein [Dyadobacter subterraneus]